ncbi:C69 family dipeptidase [Caniella muris]|uniref:C69 family dipeptidase n=1 Tax=Caniella muris TaxID=2941502 RepID=UPI002041CD52|nr:C69 family dipeptidase [Caniella muris]
MKTRWFKRAMTGLAFAAAATMAVPVNALACTQVWMPDALTAEENTWYAGRAEDSYARAVKIFGVEPRHEAGFVYQSNENGDGAEGDNFQWTSPTATYRYTYVRDHGNNGWEGFDNAYSAAGINEWGVSCSATLSIYPSTEVKTADPNVDSGIGEYNYVSIALGQSKTAREAVELLGKLVDEHGACSCDQIIISDNTESWLLDVVSGHQWVAFQLPEDQASVNPNMGSLWYKVDLDDEEKCIHSEDLVKTAEDGGFLKKFDDGTPDIARSYSRTNEGNGQFSRYVIGRAYFDALDGLDYTVDDQGRITGVTDGSLFFTPGRSDWTTFDMIRSLAARADNVTGLKDGVATTVTGVGRQDSLESHIFEIKRGTDAQVATVEWLALNRDEYSVAIPSFGALVTEVNWRYGSQELSTLHQGDRYNSDSVATARAAGEWDQYLPYVMMDLNTLANANRSDLAPGLRAYLDALQKELIADNDVVEAELRKTQGTEAREALATRAADKAAEKTWERCYKVLQEAREWLNGSREKPFAASDYDAEKGALKTPLGYADATLGEDPVVEPTYTWQQDENGKKLVDDSGEAVTDQWIDLEGHRYHLDEDGYAETGWITDEDGQTYFLRRADSAYGPEGSMGTGWLNEGGHAYFLRRADNAYGPKGSLGTGWLTEADGQTYFLRRSDNAYGPKGTLGTGWLYEGGQAYFLRRTDNQWGPRGTLGTGWLNDGGHTYFLRRAANQWGPKGTAARGWMTEGGHRFYFDWKTGRLS